jgi:hypothetical protein
MVPLSQICLFSQGSPELEARVSSVSGPVLFTGGPGQQAVAAYRGMSLFPGSVLDTNGGGRAVVSLTDGSVVVVQPDSVVTFKDFHSAGSLRELFDITLGQVRVKINHFAGRPNPYRMNSPTASIAVRGTEFIINVDPTGQTRVVVLEGSVEVTSRDDPSKRILLETGQGVYVTPGFEMQLFTPTARDLDSRARSAEKPSGGTSAPGGGGVPQGQQGNDRDQPSPRAQAGTYQLYVAGLESLNSIPLLLRYNAIPDAYLDSSENPAYATQFTEGQARVYLLPSLRGTPDPIENPISAEGAQDLPSAYSLSTQVSAYLPFAHGHFVAGGSATASYYSDPTTGTSGNPVDPGYLGPTRGMGSEATSGTSISRFLDGSALLAAKFDLNSFGIQVDTLKGNGSLASNLVDADFSGNTLQTSLTHSDILQTRLTLGYKREISARHTLGVFARYGFVDAKSRDVFNFIDARPQPLSQTVSPGHTAEVGVRLRGAVSKKLFYGMESAWLGLSLRDALTSGSSAGSQQQDRARRWSSGLGLGYLLGQRTILIGDFGSGISDVTGNRYQNGIGLLLQSGTSASHFESVHLALQREVTRRVFLLASFVNVWQGNYLAYSVFPDSTGYSQTLSDSLFSISPAYYQSPRHLSDFGAGYRFSKNLLAQYTFSTNYGYSSSSHTLMLRYTVHFAKE